VIAIKDEAKLSNTSERSRKNGEDASASSFLGYEAGLGDVFPEAIDPSSLINLDSNSNSRLGERW
ncbi:MAG: flagellar basal body L-ring protein, partial [Akkermansiaceae bacterium]|nr:flagellar basal body L-ring protein [Akkermansiaceae bacterium]